jgi:hypothetical protein
MTIEYKQVNSTLTNDELINCVASLGAEVSETGAFVKKLEDGSIEKIPEDKMLLAEKEYDTQKIYFKKIKKAMKTIVSDLSDMCELKVPLFIEQLGLDDDSDLIKKLKSPIV